MSRVYWDTMMFVYWLEDRQPYSNQIESIYNRMRARGDHLCTSTFTIGELLVGPRKTGDLDAERMIVEFFDSGEVTLLPFNRVAADRFGSIRASGNATPADAIHLACAASGGIDLFLTNDRRLRRLVVPSIQFIDGLDTTVLA